MKCTTARLIAIFFFWVGGLVTKPLTHGVGINNYFRLISDVHRYYHTSYVIFLRSDNYGLQLFMQSEEGLGPRFAWKVENPYGTVQLWTSFCPISREWGGWTSLHMENLNMTTLVHTWSRKFSRQRVMTVTITFSDLTREYNKYWKNVARPLFVVLLDTGETMNEFIEATRNIKPISSPAWFVVFFQRPGNPLEKYCRHPTDNVFNVDFSTTMLVLCYDHPILVEWYAIRDNRTRTFDLATWSHDRGLILKTREGLYARRSNMFGDVLRVTTVDKSPLISVENGTVSGFFGLLLMELSKMMNFTVEILDPVESFGGWNRDKKLWTGAIGQLVANEADIGISAFTITTRRMNVVDFTIPLIHSQNHLYFKRPSSPYVQWSGYFRAFSSGIWLTLGMIIIIASILLTIMKTKGYFSMSLMSENYIFVWGIYCQQGLPKFPSESPMRLAFLSIYISSLIILSVYSASLISFLALSSSNMPFSTLEGYVEDGSYKLIVMKDSSEYYIPTHVKDSVFLKMYELLEDKRYLPLSLSDGFKQICKQHKLAFYTTEVFKEAINIYLECELVHIDTGRIDNLAIALTKGNPYTGFMNYQLRRFQLNGVMNKLRNKNFIQNNLAWKKQGVVDFDDIRPTLAVVAGGMIVGLLILMIEKVYYSFNARSEKNGSVVKKLGHNLDVKLLKRNNRNLKRKFYNTNNSRPIGYWP